MYFYTNIVVYFPIFLMFYRLAVWPLIHTTVYFLHSTKHILFVRNVTMFGAYNENVISTDIGISNRRKERLKMMLQNESITYTIVLCWIFKETIVINMWAVVSYPGKSCVYRVSQYFLVASHICLVCFHEFLGISQIFLGSIVILSNGTIPIHPGNEPKIFGIR